MKHLLLFAMIILSATAFGQSTISLVNIVTPAKDATVSISNVTSNVEVIVEPIPGSRIVIETSVSTNFPKHINQALSKRWNLKFVHDDLTNNLEIIPSVNLKIPSYQGEVLEEKITYKIYLPRNIKSLKTI